MILTFDKIDSTINLIPKQQDLSNGFTRVYWESNDSFDQASEEILYLTIVKLASEVFGDDMSPYWSQKRSQNFFNTASRLSLIFDQSGNPIGWGGLFLKLINHQHCLYIDATGIIQRYQNKNLLVETSTKDVLDFWRKVKFQKLFLLMRTESSLVYDIFRKRAGETKIYPLINNRKVPINIQKLAKEMAIILNQEDKINLDTLVIKNAFNGPCPWRWDKNLKPLLAEGLMNSRNNRIHQFINKKLNPEDSLIIVVEVSLIGVIRCYLGINIQKLKKFFS